MRIVCPTIFRSAALGAGAVSSSVGEAIALPAQGVEKPIGDRVSTAPEPNYTLNHCFNLGKWDGFRDYVRKRRRERRHPGWNQEAQQAYEVGYQQGFTGNLSYRRDHPLSSWARPRTVP